MNESKAEKEFRLAIWWNAHSFGYCETLAEVNQSDLFLQREVADPLLEWGREQ
jgi:hypothetical protein